ncbi:MAG: phosphoribosyltransferase family protein [Clostridia bacterium]|nr:phosphoribosyltransferase family protein [Clostridia bacterium]
MKNATTQVYLSDHKKYKILEQLQLELDIKENKLGIPIESLVSMAARKNKKRAFLFVSKLLGKHIPVPPEVPRIGGYLLAHMLLKCMERDHLQGARYLIDALQDYGSIPDAVAYMDRESFKLEETTLFIGFAETATGLGNAMYRAFSGDVGYIHTTRERLKELESVFTFEEEHSHDTLHLCYTLKDNFLEKFKTIVLVDDEITTGKTALNLIRALNKKIPGKKYVVASILDWRSEKETRQYEILEEELGVEIRNISLIRGTMRHEGTITELPDIPVPKAPENHFAVDTVIIPVKNKYRFTYMESSGMEKPFSFLGVTGRFGIMEEDNREIDQFVSDSAKLLKSYRNYNRCLCLGFNEFIYIPSVIASKMGEGVSYQSTTRSPIHPIFENHYCIKTAISFKNPYDGGIQNYCYNILPGLYDEVFLFLERDIPGGDKEAIAGKMKDLGIKSLKFVVLS